MNKDAYYFPHFSNARHDRKVKRIIKELGVEGYGIYFMLLEVLREQSNFEYPMDDIDLLADEFRTSEQKVRTVICNYKLFDVTPDEKFFSPKLIEYLEPYFKMKAQRQLAGQKSAEARQRKALQQANDEQPSNDRSTTVQQSKVKKSKVNESKENIPTLQEFTDYAKQHVKNIDTGKLTLKYNSWKENGWKDGNDKQIKNWKSKLLNTLQYLPTVQIEGRQYKDFDKQEADELMKKISK